MLGMTSDQLLQIAVAVGPVLLGIAGLVVSSLLAGIGWGLRFMWATHKRQMGQTAAALTKLAQAVDADRKAHAEEIAAIQAALVAAQKEHGREVAGLRETLTRATVEAALTNRSVQDATSQTLKLAGVVESQQKDLKENNSQLGLVRGQLDAVFRFMDAPKRASDAPPA